MNNKVNEELSQEQKDEIEKTISKPIPIEIQMLQPGFNTIAEMLQIKNKTKYKREHNIKIFFKDKFLRKYQARIIYSDKHTEIIDLLEEK